MNSSRTTVLLAATLALTATAAFVGCSSSDDPSRDDAGDARANASEDSSEDDSAAKDGAGGDAGKDADLPFECPEEASTSAPTDLRCTGLYSDWSTKTLRDDVKMFEPAVRLWSDEAIKTRWIHLPPGTQIDTTNMDAWVFPVGTKTWKEFVLGGKRIETRMFWKIGPEIWVKTTYRWSADETSATRLDTGFNPNDAGDPSASGYEIPSLAECDRCHQGSPDKVLGFEAVGLGLPGAGGYTLAQLVADGRLTTNPMTTALTIPEDSTGKAGDALGWLHANCGTACHNKTDGASCRFAGMPLRLNFDDVAGTKTVPELEAYLNTVEVDSSINGGEPPKRIAKGNPSGSAVYVLAHRRDNTNQTRQMPPIGTHKVDPTGTGYLFDWISAIP